MKPLSHGDALATLNRPLATPSRFPLLLAAGRRRRNPPPLTSPGAIRAVGSSSPASHVNPVFSLPLEPPRLAPVTTVAVRRRIPAPPFFLLPSARVAATSAATRSAASLRSPLARAHGPPRAVRLRLGPPLTASTRVPLVDRPSSPNPSARRMHRSHGEPCHRHVGPLGTPRGEPSPPGSPPPLSPARLWAASPGRPAH